jgi:hypothetical protein
MTFTILDDGTVKVEVDGISGANHVSADRLVSIFAELMGGELKVEKRRDAHALAHRHEHAHGHTHTKAGH